MKKIFSGLTLGILVSALLGAFGTGRSAALAASEREPLRVLATTFPVWLIVRNITADVPGVSAELMVPARAGCPHDYALTPQDRRKLEMADILVMNGLGLEFFLGPDPAARQGERPLRVVDASQDVAGVLAGQDGEHGGPNPHLFASPRMAALMADNIGTRLAAFDPAHAQDYRANTAAYVASLTPLADEFAALGSRVVNNRIVSQHEVFDYLARDTGLIVAAVVRSDETREPSAAEMIRLVRKIREDKPGGIFTEPQYTSAIAQTLSRETGVPVAELDPVATGPDDAPLDYYQRVMKANRLTLEKTLGLR